jgi:nucleoside-diphosphate-sugar epimerase
VERTPLKLTACEVVRDYTYVEDIAARILALLMVDAVPAGTVVNVGSGQSWMLRDFVLAIARMFDAEALMQFGALEYRSTEMSSLVAEVTRLRGLIGELRSTTLDVGVRRTLARLRAGSPARC